MTRASIVLTLAAALLGGCFVVNEDHLNELRNGGGDAGPDAGDVDAGEGSDAGPEMLLNPACGGAEADYFVIRDTVENLVVDTRGMTNTVRSRCGVSNTGPNGFLALDARGGQQWHFHIQAGGADLDPLIYLLDSGCDARDCSFNSNYCQGQAGDEHFAFIAPTDGIYYLGIDDGTNPDGGQYTLSAYLLVCGDGVDAHGEACDGSGNCDDCRAQMGEATVSQEIEVNDSQVEANHIVLPASNTFTFTGSLTPDGCTYPDVFTFEVPDSSMVEVVALDSSNLPCASSSLTEDFTLTIRNAQNEVVVAPMNQAGTGCAIIEPRSLPAGSYYLWVDYVAPLTDRPANYNLRLTVSR